MVKLSKNLYKSSTGWLRFNLCKAAMFVSVLVFGYNMVHSSILNILITYFTNDGKEYHLMKAAEFVTIFYGVSGLLGIVVAYLLDSLSSTLDIICCSIASSIIGLVLFTLNSIKWESRDFVYIISMHLLGLGEGVHAHLKEFLVDQLRRHEVLAYSETKINRVIKVRKSVWLTVAWLCSAATTFFISTYSLKTIFISSTMVLVVTLMLFLSGIPFYHSKEFTGSGSSIFNFIPVVKAALLKRHLHYPSSPDQFYNPNPDHDHGRQTHLSPQVKILRWLDKAAIIESSDVCSRGQEHARLCTVTQVKEAKILLKMIPMWSTFLVVGLVSFNGNIFSSEQGVQFDTKGYWFYLVLFLQSISQATVCYVFDKFFPPKRVQETPHKKTKIWRIWIGMVLCTLFCAVAWRVEVGRFQKKLRSVYWLAPQYCLLGLMIGFSVNGLEKFMIDELPISLKNYAKAMNKFVIDGMGSILSILFMHANRTLFASTLDDSRLDKYYFRLMIISFLNICYYFVISTIYVPIVYPQAQR